MITSLGYEKSLDYSEWAMTMGHAGSRYAVIGKDSFQVGVGAGDRVLSIQPGTTHGWSIVDTADAAESLTGAPVLAGDRWDCVVIRRDWVAKTSTLVLIQGTPSKQLPAIGSGASQRRVGPGVIDDQPIALARFSAGQTAAQEIVDLRCWGGGGGLFARDLMVRDYLDDIGTSIYILGSLRIRILDATGQPTWVAATPVVSSTQPTYEENLIWAKKP